MGLEQITKQAVPHPVTSQSVKDLGSVQEFPGRYVMNATQHAKAIDQDVNETELFLVVIVEHKPQSTRGHVGRLQSRAPV
jgi:hypothetical protein